MNKNSVKAAALISKTASPDLLRDLDLTNDELLYLLGLAGDVKRKPRDYAHALDGKSIALLFDGLASREEGAPIRHQRSAAL